MSAPTLLFVSGLFLLVFLPFHSTASPSPATFSALEQFYNVTHGNQWHTRCQDNVCWCDEGSSYCTWYGIRCVEGSFDVHRVILRANGLTGDLHDALVALSELSTLTDLVITDNPHLSGTLPQALTRLTNLVDLTLSGNDVTGPLPAFLADLLALVQLDLENNRVSSSLPLAFPPLSVFIMGSNQMTGEIPSELCEVAQTLEVLRLSRNNFQGSLPTCLGNLTRLSLLDLSYNQFSGDVPASLGNVSSLQILGLENNAFTSLPQSFVALEYLETLDASSNRIPILPDWLAALRPQTLLGVNLSNNSLSGELNPAMMCIENLRRIVLSHNKLTGDIPVCPSGLTTSQVALVLMLSHNQFTGTFPSALFRYAPQLTVLDVGYNDLQGYIEESVTDAAGGGSLSYLSITGNQQMRAPQGIVSSFLALDEQDVDLDVGNKFSCSKVKLIGFSFLHVEVSPEYFNYHHCSCLRGFTGLPPDHCIPCPDHGDCTEGGEGVLWSNGYYPVVVSLAEKEEEKAVRAIIPCLDVGYTRSVCCPTGTCAGRWGSGVTSDTVLCAEGCGGRLCSHCECSRAGGSCYFFDGVQCKRCAPNSLAQAIYILVFLVLLLGFGAWLSSVWSAKIKSMSRTRADGANICVLWEALAAEVTGLWKIFWNFVQVMYAINSLWPHHTASNFYSWWSWATLVPLSTFGFQCILPNLSDPVFALAGTALTPVIFVVLAVVLSHVHRGLVWCQKRLHKGDPGPPGSFHLLQSLPREAADDTKEFQPTEWQRIVRVTVLTTHLLYFGVALSMLSVFNCNEEPVSGRRYMATHEWLECSRGTAWHAMRLIALPVLVVFVVGSPTFFLFILWSNRSRASDDRIRYCYGSLYRPYRHQGICFYFEVLVTLRRLALAGFLSFFSVMSPWQTWGVSLVLVTSLVLQVLTGPFVSTSTNILEEVGLLLLAQSYAALPHESCTQGDCAEDSLVYLHMVGNMSLLFVILLVLGHRVVRYVRLHLAVQ